MPCYKSELTAKTPVKSLQDLDAVLAELSVLNHHERELTSACNREIDAIKARYQSELVCSVGRSTVDLATRRKQLVDIAEVWCRKHLGKHLPSGERSLRVASGKVGFREQTPKVRLTDGVTEKMVIDRIDQQAGIVAAVTALLSQALQFFQLGQLIRFRPELNKVDIKAAWDAKPDGRATLTELGVTVEAGEDLVILEPTEYCVAKPAT